MMFFWQFLFIIAYLFNSAQGFNPLRRLLANIPQTPIQPNDDPGEPLFLTP
ncbi:unnamed protein product, partial [Rotaria sordida]